jgi:phospholipase A1
MKIVFLLFFSIFILLAKDIEKSESSFFNDLMDEVTSTLDANISDQMKLENMQEYFSNIEFNDKVDKDKYNFNIMGHHESYMFFGSYTKNKLYEKNWSDAYNSSVDYERDKNEAQFQISIKVPLYKRFLGTKSDLFVAYTQNSYWQVYNTEHSAPFRETNYMPELFLEWQPNKKFGESKLIKSRISLIHQSNGQDVGKSRSWNRTELYFLFKRDNFYYGFNMWDRWNEDAKPDASSTKGDDNIGLEKYIGKQKYFVKYKTDNINLTLSHQNQLFNYNINRGNTKLDIAFPSINSNFDFFVRYFDGYGESLIDYDIKIQRISFGILIADWI